MAGNGHEVLITVVLAGGTCRQTDAQEQRLLEYQHEHTGQDGVAITTRGIEDGHLVEVERTGGYLFIAGGKRVGSRYLNLASHLHRHSLRRLEYSLVGEHQTHVAVHAHMCLFAPMQFRGEV